MPTEAEDLAKQLHFPHAPLVVQTNGDPLNYMASYFVTHPLTAEDGEYALTYRAATPLEGGLVRESVARGDADRVRAMFRCWRDAIFARQQSILTRTPEAAAFDAVGATGADPVAITLDETDGLILRALERAGRAMQYADLAANAGRSEKTCKERIAPLEKAGLAVRKSQRGGFAITAAGKERLKSMLANLPN